ncbi:MAG: MATE family efflux transporter [Lachnospiraceae bacterium]|nr:MATE family efflux transporter [Lachnospiraceae bacterium]
MQSKNAHTMDMTNGPLLGKILVFSLPLMASSVLQLLFNAADMIVVGRYVGSNALAAVGATGALVNLIINIFLGLSVGTNVMVARYFGAKNDTAVSETVHTAVLTSLISGVFLAFLGYFVSHPLLKLMGTPDEVIDLSTLYMQIYFAGMPVIMFYNFGSSILRAIGDTTRPLIFLTLAGVINFLLNLLFVIVFKRSVDGVALATVLSQCVSSALVLICLLRSEGPLKLELKKLRIVPSRLVPIMKIGLPAGLQGAIFSISNVLIQSSVNSFGSIAMAGNTAAQNIEGFVYVSMNAFHQTAVSFTSQNYGARKLSRINKVLLQCIACVTVTGLVLGIGAYLIRDILLGFYTEDPVVLSYGANRLLVISTTYFLCGIMDVMVGAIRGMGYSIMPMIVSLIGACGMRILWIFTIFRVFHSLTNLYISYPVSWALTALAHLICYIIAMRKQKMSLSLNQ